MSGTNNLAFDNFYSSTLSSTITASDTVIYVNALPTASEGYLVIEPDSSSNREIIYYTSKGANFVTCPSVATGRGVGGTTAVSHNSGSTVQMNTVAEMFEDIQGGTSNTGMHQYFDESFADYIKSGGAITQATGLIASVTSGVSYINGRRLPFNAFSKTLTASKDTYFDLYETDGSNIATISYTELSSGATGSAPVSNGVHLGMVRSNASVLATIYQGNNYDVLGNMLKPSLPDGSFEKFLYGANGQNPSWISFTPNWTSSGSAPAIGNGTLTGKYIKHGTLVFFRIKFVGGSTTTWGTGNYFIDLPIPGYSGIAANDGFTLNGYGEDNGVKAYNPIGARMFDTAKFYILLNDPSNTSVLAWGATVPFTWGTGDYWSATGFYEAAY